ncbi:MAG: hypothetical protein IJ673_11905 [Treponema sp.]|nr:hypothetical protein [Treponema sp.]
MLRVRNWLRYAIRNPDTLEVIGWKSETPQAVNDEYQREIEADKDFEKYVEAELKEYGVFE